MIEAQGLSKYYGEFAAILDVSFQVRQGEVVAFLGLLRNGEFIGKEVLLSTERLAPLRWGSSPCRTISVPFDAGSGWNRASSKPGGSAGSNRTVPSPIRR